MERLNTRPNPITCQHCHGTRWTAVIDGPQLWAFDTDTLIATQDSAYAEKPNNLRLMYCDSCADKATDDMLAALQASLETNLWEWDS